MKKICVITTTHPVDDNRIYLKEINSLLSKYSVIYISTGSLEEAPDNLEVISVGSFSPGLMKRLALNSRAFKEALKLKVESYHFHDFDFIIFAVLLRIIKRKPIIYDVHEDYPAVVKTRGYRKGILGSLLSFIIYLIESFCVIFFSGIITVNNPIADRFRNLEKNVIIIPNHPRKELFENYKPKKYLKEQDLEIVHLGNLNEIRGGNVISEAIVGIDDVKLTVIGEITPSKYKDFIANKLGRDKLEITGKLPYKKAIKRASEADIGLIGYLPLPNHVESSPNKIFEYMGLGLPVVVSDLTSLKTIIDKSRAGLCYISEDSDDLVAKIKEISRKDSYESFSVNSRKAFLELYNWENEEPKLLGLYEKIIRK